MSKRRSSSPAQRKPVLLLDENMQAADIAVDLRAMECWRIELQKDYAGQVPSGCDDDAILSFCIEREWVLLTCDDMRYDHSTAHQDLLNRAQIFKVVRPAELVFLQIRSAVIAARASILRIHNQNRRSSFCAHIQLTGAVQIRRRGERLPAALPQSQIRTYRKFGTL